MPFPIPGAGPGPVDTSNMNWRWWGGGPRLPRQLLALSSAILGLTTSFFIIVLHGRLLKKTILKSGYADSSCVSCYQETLTPPHSRPRLKSPLKLEIHPSYRGWEGTGRVPLAAGRERGQGSELGAACSVGQLRPLPLPAFPIPKEDTPPSARPLPTLARYRLLAPPLQGASQTAGERGERSGMGLEGSRSGHGAGAGFLIASRDRCSRSSTVLCGAKRRTTETDPHGCVPVSLPRCRRWWLQVSAAR